MFFPLHQVYAGNLHRCRAYIFPVVKNVPVDVSARMRNKCQIINLNPYLPRVNLRQITLLGGYTHPNEQPVVFIP